MTSLLLEDHHENINTSQASEDLFQQSFQSNCNDCERPTNRIRLSQENCSDTSEEVSFIALRKPRKGLTLSNNNLNFHSKKKSGSFKSSINSSSSKYFCPISPNNSAVETDLIRPQRSPVNLIKPKCMDVHNLTKENVNVISLISESTLSDSSSVLDDSASHVSDYEFSKACFKTPGPSSVKKRIIHEWLSNVSLSTPVKPRGRNESFEIMPQVKSIDNKCKEPNLAGKSSIFNSSLSRNSYISPESETNNINNDSSLFQAHEKCSIEIFSKINEACNNNNVESLHEKDDNVSGSCENTLNSNSNVQVDLSELLRESMERSDREFPGDNKTSISKISKLSLNLSPIACSKSDAGNYSSSVESEIDDNHIETNEVVDAEDDSFCNIKFTRKKKNYLNISSDDSEAKDTANESEDRTNFELKTPKRRLYFRNPLNNSLDDDAEPVTCDDDTHKKISTSVSRKTIWKNLDNSKSIIDQICSKVLNTTENNTSLSSVGNEDSFSKTHTSSLQDLHEKINDCLNINSPREKFDEPSTPISNKSCISTIDVSPTEPHAHLDQSSPFGHCKTKLQKDQLNSSTYEDLNVNQSNITHQVSFSDLPDVTCEELSHSISYSNNQIEQATNPLSFISKSFNDDEDSHQSSSIQPEVDESSEFISPIKKHSKSNKFDFSTDGEFFYKTSDNDLLPKNRVDDSILIMSPETKTFKPLNNEEDKFIYRVRSDNDSSSESDCNHVISEGSFEDVISVHTASSDKDDDYAPWCDLETYLKKNIPATSKSFESSFSKNINKRTERLASIILPGHSSSPEHTSFLLSLTPQVPDEMCHPEAVKYRKSFSKFKNELIDVLFKLYNKDIFDNKLPLIEIKWSGRLTTTSGIAKSSSKITKKGKVRRSYIILSKAIVNSAEIMRDVLLHELCHVANWLLDEQAGGHGPLFKKWVKKIWMKYPEIPKVKTTHRYELKWNYLYKCTYCGYEHGKMKLNPNETSCRLCGGLVTVNS